MSPRHGRNPRLWTVVLGLVSVGLVLAAIIALVVTDPGKRPVCRYASGSVHIEVDGPDCTSVLRFVTSDTDRAWVVSQGPEGAIYAQVEKGPDTVKIFDHGESAFARALSGYFQKAQWRVVAPG